MDTNGNALNWFEIPVTDMARAKKFYETVFDMKMETMNMMNMEMTMFPNGADNNGKVGGALIKGEWYKPTQDAGPFIYLNANPSIQAVLDRIEGAGGKIMMPRTQISEDIGYMAFFLDSEGNRMALHAVN